ncbi:metal-dependent transcriptional regulator [Vallitalea guaymasensis]|uniref:metal-dependent transcriptional regulator n=1 Tax=Vallitalea guaymasensis TaxID=1185412 RepID=UPI000DE4154D|nr:metal-dependent transcriptional regulator [Vallitalea guaymasensis]
MLNRAEQDYIKVIIVLEDKNTEEYLSNKELVKKFGHTPQTVNETIKKLVNKDLVEYVPYKGCKLTKEGREIGTRLLRIHRIWEYFLYEKLGYTWEQVHEEAEKLEHVTSFLLEERLYEFLGRPEQCPHGSYIPKLNDSSGTN